MAWNIIAIGKIKNSPELELCNRYIQRCQTPINIIELEEKKPLPEDKLKSKEAELILSKIPDNAVVVALDETGKSFTSPELSQKINEFDGDIYFVIGGAFGLDKQIKQRANLLLSFGKMTLPHMMVRAIVCEQLYRVRTILDNHPYHKI
ncbi:MAG: 23S rRNA (pseudouridine(1915)-N(3))-methyltransferase RlmH [Alphaproteobacteria bacterium]